MNNTIKITAITVSVILLAVAIFFGVRAIKKRMDEKKFNQQDTIANPKTPAEREKNRKALANMYANQLRTAFNPSGYGWMEAFDATNTDVVMQIAAKMKQNAVPFSYVATAYQMAYKDSLGALLQSELSATELAKFYSTAGMQGVGSIGRWDARMGIGTVTDALILA